MPSFGGHPGQTGQSHIEQDLPGRSGAVLRLILMLLSSQIDGVSITRSAWQLFAHAHPKDKPVEKDLFAAILRSRRHYRPAVPSNAKTCSIACRSCCGQAKQYVCGFEVVPARRRKRYRGSAATSDLYLCCSCNREVKRLFRVKHAAGTSAEKSG